MSRQVGTPGPGVRDTGYRTVAGMFTTPTRHRLLAASAGVVLAAGLLACGGDDAGTDDTTTPPTTAAADLAGACEQYTTISHALAGDPSAAGPALDALAAAPPAEIAAPARTFVDGFKAALGGDPAVFESADFAGAVGEVGSYFFDHCELAAQIEVTGADYAYAGIPQEVDAGVVGIRFVNISTGDEPHELFLMRRPDGDTRSVDDIALLDQETVFAEYQPVGVAFANAPESSMTVLLNLEAGEYIAVCNLPTKGDETVPHSHNGMVAELSVA